MHSDDQASVSIREFFDTKIDYLSDKIDQNEEATQERHSRIENTLERLAQAMMSKEAIAEMRAEIAEDIAEMKQEVKSLVNSGQTSLERLNKLETQAAIVRWLGGAAWGLILLLIGEKLKDWFL